MNNIDPEPRPTSIVSNSPLIKILPVTFLKVGRKKSKIRQIVPLIFPIRNAKIEFSTGGFNKNSNDRAGYRGALLNPDKRTESGRHHFITHYRIRSNKKHILYAIGTYQYLLYVLYPLLSGAPCYLTN